MPVITRIYRVAIKPDLRAEFEPLFATVALSPAKESPGCVDGVIAGPPSAPPDEYAMISTWDGYGSLMAFAGPDWTDAHIPEGMERFVERCWTYHNEPMPT